jgi:hypothetical protein
MLDEAYGLDGWLVQGLLLAAGIAAPLLSTNALMSGRALPTFIELVGPRKGLTPLFAINMLGLTLIATTLIATQSSLGLIFDPRWRDFPFAALTMAVVPFWTLTLLNGPKSGVRPLAESVFSGLFAIAALYIIFNEGSHNWQAIWTGAAYFLLGKTLWRPCTVAVADTALRNRPRARSGSGAIARMRNDFVAIISYPYNLRRRGRQRRLLDRRIEGR